MTKFGIQDPYAYYDELGNRYLFFEYSEFIRFLRDLHLKNILKSRQIV